MFTDPGQIKKSRWEKPIGSRICGLLFLEHVLAQAADGADPIGGDIFPGSAGGDAVIGIANGGVINIAAGADILIHSQRSFKLI